MEDNQIFINHEIAHHNGLGETSATAMGKIGNFAYNIGTSLNQEDINTHRQTITPTEKILQNLSPEEQLTITQDNQVLLNANEVQRAWEVESGDGFEDKTIAGQIAQNKYKYCATQGVSRENCYSYIRQQNLDNLGTAAEDFAVLASVYRGGIKHTKNKPKTQPKQSATTQTKATCTTGTVCFNAGTLIETSEGLKAIETFTGGELIWSRNDITLEYGYHPVIATKATPDQPIFQVTVRNNQGEIDTLETTSEHPFWIKNTGWLKASLLEQGMILLDRNNQEVEVLSQYLIPNHTDIVYNIEVDNFHTYHVGRLGVWVHNDGCCDVIIHKSKQQSFWGSARNHQ